MRGHTFRSISATRLMNEATLAQNHITPGATVWMVLRLRGGMDAGPTFAFTKKILISFK